MALSNNVKKIIAKYDAIINISVGNSRRSKSWKTKSMSWSSLVQRLSITKYTNETMSEFRRMSKDRQDDIKDIGGFVGGVLKGGRRTATNIGDRQLITLDADYADPQFWDMLTMFSDYACCVYSTHKHTSENPRLRLVIPTDRPMSPDEYQAISRKIAEQLDIELFDDTTYQAHRLMYWPSTSADGDFYFNWRDRPFLRADEVLNEYDDWTDQSSWPRSSRVAKTIDKEAKKQEDPLTKRGMVGAFCRAYSIDEAIETFLPDAYESCGNGRYTYKAGSSSAGAVVYDDKFIYSHHCTDPCTMQLVNSFDLVRIHMYGDMDDGKTTDNATKLPSYQAMCEFASRDKKVKVLIAKEKMEDAGREFTDLGDEGDLDWASSLKYNDRTGELLSTRYNIRLILENDPGIKGTFGWDQFSQRIAIIKKPVWRSSTDDDPYWNDGDDSELRYLIETTYGLDSKLKIEDETTNVANRNAFHRVRDYLKSLNWDKKERMERVFIDYLGAEDSEYTRTVSRKFFIAGVGRVMSPGLKFDNMLVLEGPQGIGKSYLLKLLGGQWFSDSLTTVQGKEAYEQLRGCWIIEMGELAALKRSDVEPIKQFISKQVDTYRVAYGRRLTEFPRQCIFAGTTNDATFLRDKTGNRRFWPVKVGVSEVKKSLWADDIRYVIGQIWAEAYQAFSNGESVWVGKEIEEVAKEVQKAHTEENPLDGLIREFLEKPLPANWYKLDLQTRRDYFRGDTFEIDMTNSFIRDKICPLEVWCEMLGGDIKNFSSYDKKEIRDTLENLDGWKLYESGWRFLRFGSPYGQQRTYVRCGSQYDTQNAKEGPDELV